MIRIRITDAAYKAIADSLVSPDGLYEPQRCAQGGVFIWLPDITANQLLAMRARGEEVSDVIIRLCEMETAA